MSLDHEPQREDRHYRVPRPSNLERLWPLYKCRCERFGFELTTRADGGSELARHVEEVGPTPLFFDLPAFDANHVHETSVSCLRVGAIPANSPVWVPHIHSVSSIPASPGEFPPATTGLRPRRCWILGTLVGPSFGPPNTSVVSPTNKAKVRGTVTTRRG